MGVAGQLRAPRCAAPLHFRIAPLPPATMNNQHLAVQTAQSIISAHTALLHPLTMHAASPTEVRALLPQPPASGSFYFAMNLSA